MSINSVSGSTVYTFEIVDPDTELIDIHIFYPGDTETPLLVNSLRNPDGIVVQSTGIRPGIVRYDLTNINNVLGTWSIQSRRSGGSGEVTFEMTAQTGYYKIVLDAQKDIPVPPGVNDGPQLAVTKKSVSFTNLPTSSAGLRIGELYSDAGVIKIVE